MNVESDEHERTLAFAEIALGQIKALGQPAYPRNYEVWYAYATGYNQALNQAINETLARAGTLNSTDVDQIYDTYLPPARSTAPTSTICMTQIWPRPASPTASTISADKSSTRSSRSCR